MSSNLPPEDLSEHEQPIRARVPDHVSTGAFSTGVIVMTANAEVILDFVQNLGRPYQIVARVVMPHFVLPQFVDALQRNIELYRSRWGELPHPGQPAATPTSPAPPQSPLTDTQVVSPGSIAPTPAPTPQSTQAPGASSPTSQPPESPPSAPSSPTPAPMQDPPGNSSRQASAQEIYDDLKIRDELLSGAYANAVMIGHGPHEFSFDFITNFYPHSSVSSRVFLAAGQVPRLFDSLKGTWEQLRARVQPGIPPQQPPPRPRDDEPPQGPIA